MFVSFLRLEKFPDIVSSNVSLSLSLFFWDSYNVNISKPDVALESLKLCLLKIIIIIKK